MVGQDCVSHARPAVENAPTDEPLKVLVAQAVTPPARTVMAATADSSEVEDLAHKLRVVDERVAVLLDAFDQVIAGQLSVIRKHTEGEVATLPRSSRRALPRRGLPFTPRRATGGLAAGAIG
jgi:hypothetical protein